MYYGIKAHRDCSAVPTHSFMKQLFVIPCRFSRKNQQIFECLGSIKKSNPNADIVIVDSDSEDKSYMLQISRHEGIQVLDCKNKHYDTGAYWKAFDLYPDYDFYFFIHDSLSVNTDLSAVNSFFSLRYFLSSPGIGGVKFRYSYSQEFKSLFSKRLPKELNSIAGHSFTNSTQRNWAMQYLELLGYEVFPKSWYSLFGPIMFTPRNVLHDLIKLNFNAILPTNKLEQMGMELLWGLALRRINVNVTNSFQGDHFVSPLATESFTKKILARP
jgi:hypothetical protein